VNLRKIAIGAAAVVGLAASFAVASATHRRAIALQPVEDDAHVEVPAPQIARLLSLGYNELAADFMWVRTLIYYGDGMVKHNGMPDVEKLLALINTLDPRFRYPYVWGAHATTFRSAGAATQDEYRASLAVLRRGVDAFPNDWEMSWILGIRLYFDVKTDEEHEEAQKEEGAAWIEHAMHLPGAPANLSLLALSMRSALGQRDRQLEDLKEMWLTTDDDKVRAELKQRYAELVSSDAAAALEEARQQFVEEWQAEMPYVPPNFYVLVGPRPAVLDLAAIEGGP
jgi:hypothetical protein